MNILDVIRARIIQDFPDISGEELDIRLKIAYDLLNKI